MSRFHAKITDQRLLNYKRKLSASNRGFVNNHPNARKNNLQRSTGHRSIQRLVRLGLWMFTFMQPIYSPALPRLQPKSQLPKSLSNPHSPIKPGNWFVRKKSRGTTSTHKIDNRDYYSYKRVSRAGDIQMVKQTSNPSLTENWFRLTLPLRPPITISGTSARKLWRQCAKMIGPFLQVLQTGPLTISVLEMFVFSGMRCAEPFLGSGTVKCSHIQCSLRLLKTNGSHTLNNLKLALPSMLTVLLLTAMIIRCKRAAASLRAPCETFPASQRLKMPCVTRRRIEQQAWIRSLREFFVGIRQP